MFKKSRRISKFSRNPFATFHFSHVTLRIGKNNLVHNRFTVIASKRVEKRATARNAIKRKIRQCLEKIQHRIEQGYDMIIIVKKELQEEALQETCRGIKEVLKKNQLFK